MATIDLIPQSNASGDAFQRVIDDMNKQISPNNPRIQPENLDDILDTCYIMRNRLCELYNADLERARIEERELARIEARENQRLKLEKICMKRNQFKIKGPEDVRILIRAVTLYDELVNKAMDHDSFHRLASERQIPADIADAVYFAAGLNIELMRETIAKNMSLLAE
jgi:hypothetical protein